MDWTIQNHVEGADRNESLKRREALQKKLERAQEPCLEGDPSKERYLIVKENTEAELSAIDVPELDDAVEAVRILNDLSDSWKGANPGQRNRLLLAIFHGIYVDLGNREVVGLRPMKAFTALLQAMGYREDVTVCPPRMENLHGLVETGEGALLPLRRARYWSTSINHCPRRQ